MSLRIVPASPNQKLERDRLTHTAWGKRLSVDQFLIREDRLRHHHWARDNMETWLLVDDAGEIVSSCETFAMESFIPRRLNPSRGTTYGIASVFTEDLYRGKGYATQLIQKLIPMKPQAQAFVLYSEVGETIYRRAGFLPVPIRRVVYAAGPIPTDAKPRGVQLLTRGDVPFALRRATLPQDHFFIWPTEDQVDWHLERESIYSEFLDSAPPIYCGAQIGESLILWFVDHKEMALQVLFFQSSEADEAEILINEARHYAATHKLQHVWLWNREFLEPTAIPLGGQLVDLDDLPMICPLRPEFDAHDWKGVSRSIWV